jgi:hypothetical protein
MIGDQKKLTETEFNENFLKKFCSTSEGLTVRGLQDFFLESINAHGEDTVRAWLRNLGYDEHLFNPQSRAFTLTFHCSSKFSVEAKDALVTELDSWSNSTIPL